MEGSSLSSPSCLSKAEFVKQSIAAEMTDWVETYLVEVLPELFLVGVTTHPKGDFIRVYIDGDQGVTLEHCRQVSRFIEERLDTSDLVGESYELEVSSPGVKRPLTLIRQYPKHIGRQLKIAWNDGSNGVYTLQAVEGSELTLTEVSKGKKKAKNTNSVERIAKLEEIKEAIVQIAFK